MVHIETRQNEKGNWWCNTTYKGYDYSVEEPTPGEAAESILKELKKVGFNRFTESVLWEAAKYYPAKPPKEKSDGFIYPTYTNFRIDKGMV